MGAFTIGAEKVPLAPGRRGKLSLTRGNFLISIEITLVGLGHASHSHVFLKNLSF